MDVLEVKEKIEAAIPGAEAIVEGVDCNCSATVISDEFAGKTPLAKQRLVMAPFKEALASGELHALAVKAYTREEWESR